MTVAVHQRSTRSSEWTYVLLTLAAFVFTPELRRLVDWRGNFDPLNAFAVIPLLMLCPIAVLAFRRRRRLRGSAFSFVAITWLAAFTYSTFIAAAHGAAVQALYADAQFCLPMTVGAWLITCDDTMEAAHARLARALFLFGSIASAYGIIQYVVAPPWDTAWMQNTGYEGFGSPEPFGIRVFGVLNGPGVFALFVGSVILFNLPYLRVRNLVGMGGLLLMIVALMLSMVRSAWLAVLIGVIIFLWLSAQRFQAVKSIAAVVIVCGIGSFAALLAIPNPGVRDRIAERFTTLSNVQDDGSTQERRATAGATLQRAFDQPAGAGAGVTGGGSKLSTSDALLSNGVPAGPIDNGFVSRFFEMGVPGFAAFIVACCMSIGIAVRAYGRRKRWRDGAGMAVAASCIATQVVIFAINISGDGQQAILGVLFFAAFALPLMRSAPGKIAVPARASDRGAPASPSSRSRRSPSVILHPYRTANRNLTTEH